MLRSEERTSHHTPRHGPLAAQQPGAAQLPAQLATMSRRFVAQESGAAESLAMLVRKLDIDAAFGHRQQLLSKLEQKESKKPKAERLLPLTKAELLEAVKSKDEAQLVPQSEP